MESDGEKFLLVLDKDNYQKFLKMIEKEQKIRDRSYKLWQDTHEISKPRKRKDPLQYQLIGKV
jgi:hypothetical protein